jgi:hypothetical protein
MSQSTEINELAAALAAAQREMHPAKFNAVNPFMKNRYADLGSVIEASREVLTKNGLAVVQLLNGNDNNVGVETILMHKSGQWVSSDVAMSIGDEKGLSTVQSAGKLVSYLRRYSLASMLGIYAEPDDDGSKPAAPPPPAKKDAPANPLAPPTAEPIDLIPHEYRDGSLVSQGDQKEELAFDKYVAANDGAHPPTRTTLRAWAKAQTQTQTN